METILEIQRRCHEERERLVKAIVDEFMTKKPPGKEQIYSDHRVKMYLNLNLPLLDLLEILKFLVGTKFILFI
jgi:hypothetical protein